MYRVCKHNHMISVRYFLCCDYFNFLYNISISWCIGILVTMEACYLPNTRAVDSTFCTLGLFRYIMMYEPYEKVCTFWTCLYLHIITERSMHVGRQLETK